jgi:hypothetical protein
MADVVIPDFKKLVKLGHIFVNPMEQVRTDFLRGTSSFYRSCINRSGTSPNYYYSGFRESGTNFVGQNHSSTINWTYPTPPSLEFSEVASAITEAWANVSVNEAQLLVQIGEARKTVSSLISIFRRAYKIFRAIRKLDLRVLRNEISTKEVASRYMECRYALRPLMYDAMGTLHALGGAYEGLERLTSRGYKESSESAAASGIQLYVDNYIILTGNTYATRTLECRAGVLSELNPSALQLNVLGLTEPAEALWELVPFSFIVDWFFNIGQLISSWTPNLGLKTLASWYVVTDTSTLTSTVTSGVNRTSYNYESICQRNGTYSKVEVRKYRLPNPDRPVMPSFQLSLNALKTLDLGIIACQIQKIWK